MHEFGIGRAANLAIASLPGFTLPGDVSASDRYFTHDIAEPAFTLNADSTITVPAAPGLGRDRAPRRAGARGPAQPDLPPLIARPGG